MFSFFLKYKPVGIKRQNALAFFVSAWSKGTSIRFVTYGLCLWGLWVAIPTSVKENVRLYISSFIVKTVNLPIDCIEDIRNYFSTHNTLLETQDALRNENQRLKGRIFEQNMRLSDMANLKKTLDEVDFREKKSIPARVLGSVLSFPHASLFVQTQKPVSSSQVALHPQGLVGRVIQGNDRTYVRILLLTDCQSRIPVRLQKTGEQAILAGQGTDELKVLYLERVKVGNKTQDFPLEVGDLFVTSGIDHICPPNIPVAEIKYDKNGELYAKPLVDFKRLNFVVIE